MIGPITQATVDEDDSFVFRALPAEWVKEFGKVLPKVNMLRRFCNAVCNTELSGYPSTENTPAAAKTNLVAEPQLEKLHDDFLLPDSVIEPVWSGPIPAIFEDILTQLTSSAEQNVLKRNGFANCAV